ncbi:MAG: NADH:flavin oxidoreductase [Verrucomicrobiota bacterium]
MSEAPFKLTRIPTLKSVSDFKRHLATLGIEIPCDDKIETGSASPLAQAIPHLQVNGKTIGNRIAIQPMEGWDGTTDGGISDNMLRRWRRFGESGAKLIYGGEAMAVCPEGRANPNQLILSEENKAGIATLRDTLIAAHRERCGTVADLVIGFQLTHSGRFCRPNEKSRWESRVAYRHPILDKKFNVTSDTQVLSDDEIEKLILKYIEAAKIAADIGADFVDLKHCHGYLLHEFLSAFTRAGKYGGSFENRTRILREIISGIRASGNKIDLGVRLSAFDFVPFKPDPTRAQPGRLGPGIPEDFPLPYPFAFGANQNNPLEMDLQEPVRFVNLCAELGVKILNLSAGSPYYNPHIQRPAAYPPSDGYQPAHDPLIDVARQMEAVRQIKNLAPKNLIFVGSAYSYLQEYLPHVAQAVVREGWTDMIGLGRMVLSYPNILTDAISQGGLTPKFICRTFSDCTTAPRNGLISGCYPLDPYYKEKPEFQKLKEIKRATGA